MPKRPARTTLLITFLTLLSMNAFADPEGFPGGGLKPKPTAGIVQTNPLLP